MFSLLTPVRSRTRLVLPARGLAAVCAACGLVTCAAETKDWKVDQAQTSEGSVVFGLVRTEVSHAQQFMPSRKTLKGVSLFVRRLKRGRLSTTADLKVSLQPDKDGQPSGEELASAVIPYQSVSEDGNCWVDVPLSYDGLVPDAKYWLVLTIAGEPHVPKSLPPTYILEGDFGDAYPRGVHKYYGEHSDAGYPLKDEVKRSGKDWEFDFSFKTYSD
jgi:hypothetical protein